jgi:hypothetical protein
MGCQARSTYVFGTNFEAAEFIAYLLKEMGSREATPRDLAAAKQQFEALLKRNPQVGKGSSSPSTMRQILAPPALEHLGAPSFFGASHRASPLPSPVSVASLAGAIPKVSDWRFCQARGVLLVSVGCVGLTLLGFFLSPPSGPD